MRSTSAFLTLALLAPVARAETWRAEPPDGRIVVNVDKKGALSGFAHDHHFEVTRWNATAEIPEGDLRSTSVDVVLQADSLRDRQQSLSDGDRKKVDAQAAGPEVLDATHYPRIELRSTRLELEPGGDATHVRGKLSGTLEARGKSVPVVIAVEGQRLADEWRVRGNATVKQSALGIKPFSGFAGTVSVKDDLRIELAVILKRGAASGTTSR
jgi:polyisoprenoid-binding protein YceI